MVFVKYKEQYF